MQGKTMFLYLTFWGKAEVKTSRWHPLICHMLDVANITKCLLNSSINNISQNLLSRYYDDETGKAVDKIAFLTSLHDLGKASPPFQGLWREHCRKNLIPNGLKFPPINDSTKKHGLMTSSLIMNVITEKDKTLQVAFEKIAISLGGHHGIMAEKNKWRDFASNKFLAGSATWHDSRNELAKKINELVTNNNSDIDLKQMIIEALPSKDKLKQLKDDDTFFMLLSGLTSIADWLGSSTEWFEFAKLSNPIELESYNNKSHISAKNAVESIWKENLRLEKDFVDGRSLFLHLFPSIDKPRPMQDLCVNLYPYPANSKDKVRKRIVIIEAPTGEGKTEASFYLMDNWLRNEDTKGAYVALPTQATSNQMFERFANFLSIGHGQNIGINLLHSMKDFNPTWIEINNKTLSDGKYDALVANLWFESPKRRLITPFGVGTIDQTLMGVLQVKHMFVRLFGLSGKTVIFDEVHAYDIYMSTLLERLIQWLSALGSSVILLSATLPSQQKKKLLKAYTGNDKFLDLKPLYPAITYSDQSLKPQITEFKSNPNIRQNITIVPVENDIQCVSKKLLDKISKGGCAAWICNTVKKSQEVYAYLSNQLEDGKDLLLFHARFMASDRLAIEKQLLNTMGKPGIANRPQKAIIVATQVIEQSLDLDFDVMVSELSPIDLLIQRVGRLHRHNRDTRPESCLEPEIMLMMPDIVKDIPDFGINKCVYDESILLRTFLVLSSRLENGTYKFCDRDETVKELVEQVYGNFKLKATPNLLSHLSALDKAFDKEREETELLAHERVIDPPLSSNQNDSDDNHVNFSFINTIEIDDDNPDISDKFKALTRLSSGPSIKIVCVFESNGKYFLDTKSSLPIDLSKPPSTVQELESILLNTISVSDKAAYFKLIDKGLIPKVWLEIPSLRHLPLLVFKYINNQWQIKIDSLKMSYSSQIGFQISKEVNA